MCCLFCKGAMVDKTFVLSCNAIEGYTTVRFQHCCNSVENGRCSGVENGTVVGCSNFLIKN